MSSVSTLTILYSESLCNNWKCYEFIMIWQPFPRRTLVRRRAAWSHLNNSQINETLLWRKIHLIYLQYFNGLFNSGRRGPPSSHSKAICDYFRISLLRYHFVNHCCWLAGLLPYIRLLGSIFKRGDIEKVRRWKMPPPFVTTFGTRWRSKVPARPVCTSGRSVFFFSANVRRNANLMVSVLRP